MNPPPRTSRGSQTLKFAGSLDGLATVQTAELLGLRVVHHLEGRERLKGGACQGEAHD